MMSEFRPPPMTIITPTSDRPAGLTLAKRWMAQQIITFPLAVQWLIVDDGRTPAAVTGGTVKNGGMTVTVEHVRKPPTDNVALSFRGNVATGLVKAQHDRIVFWEDDDYYPPAWLGWIVGQFERGWQLIGEAHARYYNVATRRFRTLTNRTRASLCQTAMTRDVAAWLDRRCRTKGGTFIDIDLWERGPAAKRFLRSTSTVVGIKGLPGKPGIGIGHRFGRDNARPDPGLAQLRQWIGDDADAYAPFYELKGA